MGFEHSEPIESNAPAQHGAAVTPHDTNNLSRTTRGLWVGGEGSLKVLMVGDDSPVTLVAAQGWFPLAVVRVYSTGTTASEIIAFW